MSSFIEQCRREWKRLGVPNPVAEEMATDLAADLQEAEAEGASPEDVLGADAADPRVFAAAWATERGVAKRQPKTERRRRPLLIAALVLVTLLLGLSILGAVMLAGLGSPKQSGATTQMQAPAVTVPNLLAYKEGQAANIASSYGFKLVGVSQKGSPDGYVFAQSPRGGTVAPRGSTVTIYVNVCREPGGCRKNHSAG